MSNPYTSEQEALRAAITNFIGIAATSSMYEGKDAVRNVIALFLEELIKYTQTDDGINMNTTKPIFRATIFILEERKKDILNSYVKSFNSDPPATLTQEIDLLIESLNNYLNRLC